MIFDLGGVIVPFDFKIGYAKMERLCGHSMEEIRRRLRSTDWVTQLECGRMDPEEFVGRISGLLEMNITFAEFSDLWCSVFLPDTLMPDCVMERIHARHRLLLLSNTNDIHFSMIERSYPILRHFDDHVLSYQVGAMKPSPQIYREAVARAGCKPEECFFTDDVAANVEAALHEGIDAVQFESAEQVQEALRVRGVLRA